MLTIMNTPLLKCTNIKAMLYVPYRLHARVINVWNNKGK